MVLVLLGTQNNSFIRLLEQVQKNINDGKIREQVVAQIGYTKFESEDMTLYSHISPEKLEELVKESNLVITHGGVGSIVLSITNNKKVIAVPRLQKYKEHVNDHQLEIINSFNNMGYIIGVQSVEDLDGAIERVKNFEPKKYEKNTGKILKLVEDFIKNN